MTKYPFKDYEWAVAIGRSHYGYSCGVPREVCLDDRCIVSSLDLGLLKTRVEAAFTEYQATWTPRTPMPPVKPPRVVEKFSDYLVRRGMSEARPVVATCACKAIEEHASQCDDAPGEYYVRLPGGLVMRFTLEGF